VKTRWWHPTRWAPTNNLKKKSLVTFLLAGLFLTAFVPSLSLGISSPHYLLPSLAIALYQLPLFPALLLALGEGFYFDLLSDTQRLGINALLYMAAMATAHSLKTLLFADRPSTLPIISGFLSLLVHSLLLLFLLLAERISISPLHLLAYLGKTTWEQCVFAIVVGPLPVFLLGKRSFKGREYFLDR